MTRPLSTNLARASTPKKNKPKPKFPKRKNPKYLRSTEAAWTLVREADVYRSLIRTGIIYWNLDRQIPHEDARQLATISAFQSALRWNPAKHPDFFIHAIHEMKSCWREITEMSSVVHVPAYMVEALERRGKWLKKNPTKEPKDFFASKSFAQFIERTKCDPEEVRNNLPRAALALHSISEFDAFNSVVSATAQEKAQAKYVLQKMPKDTSGNFASSGLSIQERYTLIEAVGRAANVALRTLDARGRKILSMRFGINGYKREHEWGEIGKAFGFSKQRAAKLGLGLIKSLKKDAQLFEVWEEL